MNSSDARLILLPGLRADERLFEAQQTAFPNLEVPPWLAPNKSESLADFGARMAKQVNPEPPYFIGGVSFGGMVAQEMARRLKPLGLITIASCHSGSCLPRSARLLEHLARLTPTGTEQPLWLLSPVISYAFGHLAPEHKRVFWAMIRDADKRLSRWTYRAILEWPGGVNISCPTLKIHGVRDRVIPARNVDPDQIIEGAGHLVNVTHANIVNQHIYDWISGILIDKQLAVD